MTCLLPKTFPKQYSNLLIRLQSVTFVQNCGYVHNVILNKKGPIAILKDKIATGKLMKDDHQMKVAETLQGIYEEINGYKPEELTVLDKWLGKKRKQPPKGLYLYGAVGGGKTMLMDLFYDCCQVSRFAVPISIAHGESEFMLFTLDIFIMFFRIIPRVVESFLR